MKGGLVSQVPQRLLDSNNINTFGIFVLKKWDHHGFSMLEG